MKRRRLLLGAATALSATPLWASTGARGAGASLQLQVLDRDGKPAPDVVLLLEATDSARQSAIKPAREPVTIVQEGLRFVPFLTVVPAGSTVRFVNRDDYDHHVRSVPSGPLGAIAPVTAFELRLGAAGAAAAAPKTPTRVQAAAPAASAAATTADLVLGVPGAIGLGCHLHSSMRGQLYVSGTPWFAKTDASGRATLEAVPEGAVRVRLWHSDQLTEQPLLTLTVAAGVQQVAAALNFTPRRRRRG